jgi:DNA-binding transcriptional MocR family regulator
MAFADRRQSRPAISGRTARDIAISVEARIRDGKLQPGSRLPTIRELAAQAGVSPTTVTAAYRELSRRGLVSAAGRRGTRVREQPPLPVTPAPLVPPGSRDLATGNPDPDLLPAVASALTGLASRPRAHPYASKLDRLVELAEAAFVADGIPVPALAVVAGALDGVERVLTAQLVAGDVIALEDPTFPRIADLLRALGLVPVPVEVDDDGPSPRDLERAFGRGAKALMLTPRWQNPFGSRLTAERVAEVREVLDHFEDVLVVEDDFAGLIAGEPAFSVGAGRKRWATIRSVSKALGADFRLALVTGDRATIARVEGRQLLATGWVSHVLQELVANLWSDAETQAAIAEARAVYNARRLLMLRELAERGIKAYGASGLNVWIPVPEEASTLAAMLQRGWAIAAGERWRQRSGPAVRITISTLQEHEIAAVTDDLAAVLERRPGVFSS